jgi:hypothetical protein
VRYNIYCDEASISAARYMLIGGLWVPWEREDVLRQELNCVRQEYNLRAEMKWTKVSAAKLAAYKSFVDAFLATDGVQFRCIVVDTHILDHDTFNKGDEELGFYKFYFQLVSRNLIPGNLYWLYTDARSNRKPYRLAVLKLTVNRWCKREKKVDPLRNVEPRRSDQEDCIQLADVLLGAVSYHWNGHSESPAKVDLAAHIAAQHGYPHLAVATPRLGARFNIWHWQPAAGVRYRKK